MTIEEEVAALARAARGASRKMAGLGTEIKNHALARMAQALEQRTEEILESNTEDMDNARQKGLNKAMLDRLLLTPERIQETARGLRDLVNLPDPIGEVTGMWNRPNGLQIGRVRVPLGVIGIIYESRPNVTVDVVGLCVKTGNAVLLRGGSEALNSNKALVRVLAQAAQSCGVPEGTITLVGSADREAVSVMLRLNEYLDVLIPRGGAGLIRTVVEKASVPVIETGVGNCHVYVDEEADLAMAMDIVVNAKTQRPAVCNAMETLLVHASEAASFLPSLAERFQVLGVELRGCPRTLEILSGIREAGEEDWAAEYLDLILAVKVVDSLDEAIEHIHEYGTKHSEAIVTRDYARARRFLAEVDAACVYVNSSTRFTDGFQFGFGAEVGISTQKLHARGPMGLEALTTIKYIIHGSGQVRH